MNKQKVFGISLLVAVALLVVGTGAVFAAEMTQAGPPFSTENDSDDDGEFWGPMHGRRGDGAFEANFLMHDALIQAVADATGLSVDEINTRLEDGERLVSIALETGLDEEGFFELMAEIRETVMAEALEDGLISEEQYQWMLEGRGGNPGGRGSGGCYQLNEDGTLAGERGLGRGNKGRW